MVKVAEIAEDCTLPGEAFQKIIFDGGLIVLIFEDNDEHVVEMLWRGRGTGAGGNILRKAENREGPNEKCFTCKTVDVAAPERHDPPKFHVPLVRQDYPWTAFRSVLMLTPNLAATPRTPKPSVLTRIGIPQISNLVGLELPCSRSGISQKACGTRHLFDELPQLTCAFERSRIPAQIA